MQTNLYTFVDNMKQDLRNFEEEWEDKHRSEPENYPMFLDESLWDEMFRIYLQSGEV